MTEYLVELGRQVTPGRFAYQGIGPGGGSPYSGVSREPLLDACRQLKRVGADPAHKAALSRGGRADLRCGIGWGAARTVEDGSNGLTKFRRWRDLSEVWPKTAEG